MNELIAGYRAASSDSKATNRAEWSGIWKARTTEHSKNIILLSTLIERIRNAIKYNKIQIYRDLCYTEFLMDRYR